MVVYQSTPTEIIVSQGKEKFRGISQAKSMRGWINGMISKYAKSGNTEYEFAFREILNAYNKFHPEKKIELELNKWKGKSSFEIIKGLDKITIIRWQRRNKDSEPEETRVDISREEINAVIGSIKELALSQKSIDTKDIALKWCHKLDIRFNHKGRDLFEGGYFWQNFFSSRDLHLKLNLCLGALDYLGLIKYIGGKTTLLDKDISIQMIL